MERGREQLHAPARADDVAIAAGYRGALASVSTSGAASFVVLALDEQRAQTRAFPADGRLWWPT
jgi:hypothetical protein